MNISLTSQLERMIKNEIKGGRYCTASEVVRDALRMFNDRKKDLARKLKQLRRDIQIGIDQLDRGQSTPFDDNLAESIKREGRKRLARLRSAKRRQAAK